MKYSLFVWCVLVSCLFIGTSLPASAAYSCNVDLNYGVVASDDRLRVIKKYQTLYQINGQDQLFVQGNWQKLSSAQATLLRNYAEGIHAVVPQVTLLATIGIDLATDAVQQMYLSLVGDDHDSYDRLNEAVDKIKQRVRMKFRYARSNYYIGPSTYYQDEKLNDDDFGLPISNTLPTSVGAILSSLGSMDSDKLTMDEEAMNNINQRLARYALKTGVDGPPAKSSLVEKARWYCDYFKRLDAFETQLQQTVPAMAPFNLIEVN